MCTKRSKWTFVAALFAVIVVACCSFNHARHVKAVDPEETFKAVYNVRNKAFGAKPGKDATEAIQKALDKAHKKATANKRVKVYIPSGTYYISKTLTIYSNTYLQCDAGTKIIKKKKNGKRMLYMLSSTSYGAKAKKGYNNIKNVTVDGGSWDAKFIKFNKQTGGSVFFFAHGNNLEFTNVTLKNNYGTHLLELGGVSDVEVTNSKFYGFKKSVKNDDKEAIQIDVCHNYDILPMGGPFDDTPCKDIVIKNNEIYNYPRAIGSHSYVKDIYPTNITIENNYIHDISDNAVYAYNYKNLTVTGNTFERVTAAVVFKTLAIEAKHTVYNRNKGVKAMPLPGRRYDIKILNNTINTTNKSVSSDPTQIGIFVYGTDKLPIRGCEISGNTINSASSAVYLRYIEDSKISNNIAHRLNQSSSSKFVVDAYKFLTCSRCEISGNTSDKSSGYMYENGLAFRENCSGNTVAGNVISNAEKHGIGVYNSTATISGNTIQAAGQHGIAIVDKATASINSNVITNSGLNGITITEASASGISGNQIKDNGATGLSIQNNSSVTDVSSNELFNNNGKAIAINSSRVDSVTSNKMLSINCEWELTAVDSKTPVESFRTISVNPIVPGAESISGLCTYNGKVYAVINGTVYNGLVKSKDYNITVPAIVAGTPIVICQEDAYHNQVIVNR